MVTCKWLLVYVIFFYGNRNFIFPIVSYLLLHRSRFVRMWDQTNFPGNFIFNPREGLFKT